MHELLTFGRYLRRRFGLPVWKIPLSVPGFTCPNIDGTESGIFHLLRKRLL